MDKEKRILVSCPRDCGWKLLEHFARFHSSEGWVNVREVSGYRSDCGGCGRQFIIWKGGIKIKDSGDFGGEQVLRVQKDQVMGRALVCSLTK
ncbi:hypothetical protein KQX54_021083 [Cotesia glomerata]|uniref:Uncharacterized protein n=1 Tax=Cotesia glomerata TaxID=32391 RepID=A0AAV7J9V2_COTGL|nr:hypothetical protein KQX54_021083 [Cotesia glomerata]